MKTSRLLALALSLCLMFTLMVSCSAPESEGTDAGTSSEAPASSEAEEVEEVEPSQLTIFMNNFNQTPPEGTDYGDNEFINVAKEMANVSELEAIVPAYNDFKDKFNLMMNGGDLPDIVMTYFPIEADAYGDQGAFIDLKGYYDASTSNLKNVVTPEMMEASKSSSGSYYRIPGVNLSTYGGVRAITPLARYDYVETYNDGEWPGTIDEWTAYFETIKAAEPETVMLADRLFSGLAFKYVGEPIFLMYGVQPYSYQIRDGEVVNTFELPEFKAAVELMQSYYEAGYIQTDFATSDTTKWSDIRDNKNAQIMSYDSYYALNMTNATRNGGNEEAIWLNMPQLEEYPDVVSDTRYTVMASRPMIADHGLYITTASEDPDGAFRLIEAFSSEEFYEKIYIGEEGIDYEMVDGEKKYLEAYMTPERRWVRAYGFMFSYTEGDGIIYNDTYADKWGADTYQMVIDNITETTAKSNSERGVDLNWVLPVIDGVTEKVGEANAFISEVVTKTVMGEMTSEEYDAKVAEYESLYGYMADEYQAYVDANKDLLRSKGVMEVDW